MVGGASGVTQSQGAGLEAGLSDAQRTNGAHAECSDAEAESCYRHGLEAAQMAKRLAANWPRWTFAPADADALIGMKFSALAQSPVLSALLGEDAAKQVEEAWVSIRSLPGQKAEAVVLLIGPGSSPSPPVSGRKASPFVSWIG